MADRDIIDNWRETLADPILTMEELTQSWAALLATPYRLWRGPREVRLGSADIS